MTRPRPRALMAGLAVAVLAAVFAGRIALRFAEQITTGTAVAAKQLCSLYFVSGLEPARASALYLEGLLRGADQQMHVQIDDESDTGSGLMRKAVTVSLSGFFENRAVYRPAYGCTLVRDAGLPLQPEAGEPPSSTAMTLDRAQRQQHFDEAALDDALARAFEPEPGDPPLQTLAVAVLHDGRLVAERYARGITAETRLPGWSMTKSVTATLAGVLVQHGRLDMHAPGAIRAWRGNDDPRSRISIDQLLRMTSGLRLTEGGEHGDGRDPTSRMLYRQDDAASFAAAQPLAHPVGEHFEYMSGNTVLAMRALQDAIDGDLHEDHAFFHAHLFEPLGMRSATLEADASGTFLGSTHMLATAHDWARLGQLYVDGGVAKDRRLLPEGWVAYVASPTPQSTSKQRGDVFWEPGRGAYGAGFWLFAGAEAAEAGAGTSERSALPSDAFDANGFQGQYVHILPSAKLVVVRLGATNHRGHDHDRLPAEVLAALRRP